MVKGKTIQEQFKELKGNIIRKYLSEKIDKLEKKNKYPDILKYLKKILLKEI